MRLLITFVIVFSLALSGCGNKNSGGKKEVVAYVNKEPIYLSDVKRELAMRAKLDPTFTITPEIEKKQLDQMIDKKIVTQEAMKKGLAREDRFVTTIKDFWEQTLVRDFLDIKRRDFQDYLFVTNEEVKEYYDNLSKKVTLRFFRSDSKKAAEDALDKYKKDRDAALWRILGPLGYEDLASQAIRDAFSMDRGSMGIFEEDPYFYVVEVIDIERKQIDPLDGMKAQIEKQLIVMKEQRLFEDWLKTKRKRSNIKIFKERLSQ